MTTSESFELRLTFHPLTREIAVVPKDEIDDFAQILSDLEYVESIERATTANTEVGTKGPTIDFGQLLITISEAGAFSSLINVIGKFFEQSQNISVEVHIGGNSYKGNHLTKKEKEQLIQMFLKACEEEKKKGKKNGKDRASHR